MFSVTNTTELTNDICYVFRAWSWTRETGSEAQIEL